MKTKAPTLIHTAILSTFATILICYGLTVTHVQTRLPFISHCGIDTPERYPFRVGLVVGALLLALDVILSYGAGIGSKNKVCLILGLISSVGLAVVAVVNLKENKEIHASMYILLNIAVILLFYLVGAAAFFICYDIYMVIMTCYSLGEKKIGSISLRTKVVCSIIGVITLLLFVFLGKSFFVLADLKTLSLLAVLVNSEKYKLYIAMCEWYIL